MGGRAFEQHASHEREDRGKEALCVVEWRNSIAAITDVQLQHLKQHGDAEDHHRDD
jgi:hypothetical protein